MDQKIKTSYYGERLYRVNKSNLHKELGETSTLNQFEKHILQEGVKQVLFGLGTEQIYIFEDDNAHSSNKVTDEMIRLLLDYKLIELI